MAQVIALINTEVTLMALYKSKHCVYTALTHLKNSEILNEAKCLPTNDQNNLDLSNVRIHAQLLVSRIKTRSAARYYEQ